MPDKPQVPVAPPAQGGQPSEQRGVLDQFVAPALASGAGALLANGISNIVKKDKK